MRGYVHRRLFRTGEHRIRSEKDSLPSGCQATLAASCWWVGEWEVGISQVKIPQSSLLFFLSQYSPDCYKPSVNFQSPDNFCVFALVLWWRTFWRSFLHCFCWRHSCYSFWEDLCLFQFLFLCMWPVISDRFCCFLCLIEVLKIFSSVLKFHNDVTWCEPFCTHWAGSFRISTVSLKYFLYCFSFW